MALLDPALDLAGRHVGLAPAGKVAMGVDVAAMMAIIAGAVAVRGWTRQDGAVEVTGTGIARIVDLRDPEAVRAQVKGLLAASETMRIAFQPVVDLRDGTIVGREALARFSDGRSPAMWFAEAHQIGMGTDLELRAIALALALAAPGQRVAVNVSPSTLGHRDLVGLMAAHHHLDIDLELTEHAIVEDYNVLVENLAPLRATGVRVAVDDAGSGYASLRHVLSLRPDVIKLDRSIITEIHNDGARKALASSLVFFAANIGAELVAEGIELEEELHACEQLGIVYAQGYLLGKPTIADPTPARGATNA